MIDLPLDERLQKLGIYVTPFTKYQIDNRLLVDNKGNDIGYYCPNDAWKIFIYKNKKQ